MALVVQRPKLNIFEKMYFPAIVAGLAITLKHFKNLLAGKTKVTMQYPEEKWDSKLPAWYRGAPALVKDEHGKDRCVACQLCEFICPPRAITITPMEIPAADRWAKVEKRPKEFEIDMIRCIYCGLCEEVCPGAGHFPEKGILHHRLQPAGDEAQQGEALRNGRSGHGLGEQVEREKSSRAAQGLLKPPPPYQLPHAARPFWYLPS